MHALHNIATCWLRGPIAVESICREVGRHRDDGLLDVRLRRVPIAVHARGIPVGKYRYLIEDDRPPLPIQGTHSWCVCPRLDVDSMHRAAQYLVGEHDFTSFRTVRCTAPIPRKRIDTVRVSRQSDGRIAIDIRGRSFLRRMVRIIAGTLAEVGAGFRQPDEIPAVLAQQQRRAAGLTAPAHALTLVEVHHPLRVDPFRR